MENSCMRRINAWLNSRAYRPSTLYSLPILLYSTLLCSTLYSLLYSLLSTFFSPLYYSPSLFSPLSSLLSSLLSHVCWGWAGLGWAWLCAPASPGTGCTGGMAMAANGHVNTPRHGHPDTVHHTEMVWYMNDDMAVRLRVLGRWTGGGAT